MGEGIEIWKKVDENGIYEVSSHGNLRKVKKAKQGLIQLKLTKKGYLLARITIDGKRTGGGVHRLVAIAFIPNPDNLPEVNHKDGNKQNNFCLNIEWVTHQRNIDHAVETGLYRDKMKPEKLWNSKIVLAMDTGIFYYTIHEAAKAHNISHKYMSMQLNGTKRNRTSLQIL